MKNTSYKLLSLVGVAAIASSSLFAQARPERIERKVFDPKIEQSIKGATPAAKDLAKPTISDGSRAKPLTQSVCPITSGNLSQSVMPVISAAGFSATIQADAAGQLTKVYANFAKATEGLVANKGYIQNAVSTVTSTGAVDANVMQGLQILVDANTGAVEAMKTSTASADRDLVKNAEACAVGAASCDVAKYEAFETAVWNKGGREVMAAKLGEEATKEFESAGCLKSTGLGKFSI